MNEDSTHRDSKQRSFPTGIFIVTAVAFLSCGLLAGYFYGSRDRMYRNARFQIVYAISNNAKLKAGKYDQVEKDNDTLILGNYYGIQTLPEPLLPVFTIREEKRSEAHVLSMSDEIEEVLRRRGVSETRVNIENAVRDWLAYSSRGSFP